jgi:hypothetical protein
MKLAAGYVVFDGLETLESSIRSIRSEVDIVIVSYQTISWGGTQAKPELIPTLTRLRDLKLIDHLIEFTRFIPSPLASHESVMMAKSFELNKRQSCLELAKALGATHYLSMDADECYRSSEFAWAKKEIEENSLDATAVHYINYVTPTLHRGYSRWRVPFIYRITPNCRHHLMQGIFTGVDPTRGLLEDTYAKSRIFERDKLSMHHMEMVRHDVAQKYYASSRYFVNRDSIPNLAQDVSRARETGSLTFTGVHLGDNDEPRKPHELIRCENEFGIDF